MYKLNELIKAMPPELHQEAEAYLESLIARKGRKPKRALKLDWRGGLEDLEDRYTSVDLQHKSSQWWGDCAVELQIPNVENVTVTEDTLMVELSDGRKLSVPLAWFPRLLHASPQERNNWRLICKGHGIHWDDLDEDISVEGLLAGRPSGESQASFKKWVEGRELI